MSSVRFSHYKWLGQTLEFMNVPYIYNESIDVFDNNNTRTSYGTTICCIKKQRQDLKNYHTTDDFGHDIRLAVSTEEYMSRNADTCHITEASEHIKLPCVVLFRTKKHKTYSFTTNFQIEMTETTVSSQPNKTCYEVEIELKPYRYIVHTGELNGVLFFVLKNLWGRSEIL